MASSIPKEVKKVIADTLVAEGTWKVALYTSSSCLVLSSYSATGEVASGNGYTTGGKVLASLADAYDGEYVNITATNAAWTASTFSASYALVYNSSTLLVKARFDFGGTKTVTNGTFTLQWDADGLFSIK